MVTPFGWLLTDIVYCWTKIQVIGHRECIICISWIKRCALWPTGLQAAPGIPGVVKGVYCTDSIAIGTTHCQNWHADALARDNHLTIYEIKPAHPKHSQFLNTNIVGFFCCGEVVDVSPAAIALGHVAITHT